MTAEPEKTTEPQAGHPATADAAEAAASKVGTMDGAAAQPAPEGDRIAQLEAEVAALKDQLLRAVAETENVRRRAEREREDTAKFAVSKFAKELLPVADNLRRALDAVPADARTGNDQLNMLMVGVEATERQLNAAFDRFGVKKIEALDQAFDPNLHQVMFEVENTGKPAGTVVQVLQDGYTLHERLLREALVGVAKGDAKDPALHVDTTA